MVKMALPIGHEKREGTVKQDLRKFLIPQEKSSASRLDKKSSREGKRQLRIR